MTSKIVLSSGLPRVFEETGGGKVVPVCTRIEVNILHTLKLLLTRVQRLLAHQVATGPVGPSGASPIGGMDFSAEECDIGLYCVLTALTP